MGFSCAYIAEYFKVARIAIAQTKFKEEHEHKVEPIAYGVFAPFFFVSIGLAVSFNGIGKQIGIILYPFNFNSS